MSGSRQTLARLATTAVFATTLAWAPLARTADLNTEMQQMFNDIGAMSSVTGPSAYKGQAMSLYMGGDMQIRTPIRSYQLYNFVLPSVRSSCGGVDAFLGSFSHIDSAAFKAMLQQIANNTVGLLFQAALASIQPLIASKLEWLQNIIQQANIGNVNTCSMAKNIVGGITGQMGIGAYDNCVAVGTFFGWDQEEARRQCKNDPITPQKTVASSGDPIYSKVPDRDINLMWWALTNTGFTKDEKETFINIAGSYIVYRVTDAGEPRMPKGIEPMNDDAFALLIGNAPGSSADKVKIAWWKCVDADCIDMDPTATTEVTPFTTVVETRLVDIRNKLATATALTPAEIAFINTTTLPVWKMLTLGYSAPDSTLSDLLIQKYKTVIAYDYAQTFMRRAMKEARFYLTQSGVRNAIEEKKLDKLLEDLSRRTDRLTSQYIASRQGIRDMNAFTEDLQGVERSLMTAIPFRLKSSLDFSGSIARVGR